MRTFLVIAIGVVFLTRMEAQTFNKRLVFSNGDTQGSNSCFERNDQNYLFFGSYYDTLGSARVGNITTDLMGNPTNEFISSIDSSFIFLGYYGATDQYVDGYVTCATYNYPPFDQVEGEVILFNSTGDTVWTKIYHPAPGENVYFYKALKVDNAILVIGSSVTDGNFQKGLLLKFDDEGNFLWRKDYTALGVGLILFSAVEIEDGFLLGGSRTTPNNWDNLVIKTDYDGTEVWRKFFGDQYQNNPAIVCNTSDGKYVFGGNSSTGEFDKASSVTKLNTNGSVSWSHTYGEYGFDCWVNAIKQMPDGGFVFCGSDRSTGVHFGYICHIDSAGTQMWYRKYTQTDGNWCYLTDVIHTSDNGFLLTGDLYPDPGLTQDIWALKLDSLGCLVPGCSVGIIEEGKQASFSIYPNPADDFINVFVESESLHHCQLKLLDMQGRIIYNTQVTESGNTYMMDSSVLAEGVYLLQLQLEHGIVKSEKVIVRH